MSNSSVTLAVAVGGKIGKIVLNLRPIKSSDGL